MITKKDLQDARDAYERGDYKTAYKITFPLAQEGYIGCQFNLGIMYSEGQGVPQNHKEAFYWYRLAAEQGHSKAQTNLDALSKKTGVWEKVKEFFN